MKQDKALRKALQQNEAQLSYDFHNQVMKRIYLKAEHINKREFVMSIVLAGLGSMILMAGAVYVLSVYSNFSIRYLIPNINLNFLTNTSVVYSACFALIVFVLLTLDLLLRNIIGKAGW